MIVIFSLVALGLGVGFIIGSVFVFLTSTLPLTRMLARLRYDGFRPEALPVRPKTVPPPETSPGD